MKKLILIPITLTTLTPLVNIVGCNNSNTPKPIGFVDIRQIYSPTIQQYQGSTISINDAIAKYINVNNKDRAKNNVFVQDMLYSTSIAYQKWYAPSPNNFTKYEVKVVTDDTKIDEDNKVKFSFYTNLAGTYFISPASFECVYTDFDLSIQADMLWDTSINFETITVKQQDITELQLKSNSQDDLYMHFKITGHLTYDGQYYEYNFDDDANLFSADPNIDPWIEMVSRLIFSEGGPAILEVSSYYFANTKIS